VGPLVCTKHSSHIPPVKPNHTRRLRRLLPVVGVEGDAGGGRGDKPLAYDTYLWRMLQLRGHGRWGKCDDRHGVSNTDGTLRHSPTAHTIRAAPDDVGTERGKVLAILAARHLWPLRPCRGVASWGGDGRGNGLDLQARGEGLRARQPRLPGRRGSQGSRVLRRGHTREAPRRLRGLWPRHRRYKETLATDRISAERGTTRTRRDVGWR
jgi:hypothetical protein